MQKALSVSAFALLLAAVFASFFLISFANNSPQSVELGLAELSPRGLAGGFAMPASGASVDLYWRQNGGQAWYTTSPAELPNDRAVDLRWISSGGITVCTFTSGYIAPSGNQAVSSISLGDPVGRILSQNGGASTYTISCNDTHGVAGGAVEHTLTDSVELSLETPECSDGVDNDGDGDIDFPADGECDNDDDDEDPECSDNIDNGDIEDTYADEADPGCWDEEDDPTTYDDNDDDEYDDGTYDPEIPGAFDMTLEACKDNGNTCVSHPGTLKIDDTDVVVLNWTSDADECSRVEGPFTTPSGNPADASNVPVDEPDEGERNVRAMVGCVKDSDTVVKYVFIDHPAIELVPYPQPPIIPGGGMPADDPATVTPIINEYKAHLCYLTGPGIASDTTLADMVADDSLVDGHYDVNSAIKLKGETTFMLSCYADYDDDDLADSDVPVTDTATFRVLPVVEET